MIGLLRILSSKLLELWLWNHLKSPFYVVIVEKLSLYRELWRTKNLAWCTSWTEEELTAKKIYGQNLWEGDWFYNQAKMTLTVIRRKSRFCDLEHNGEIKSKWNLLCRRDPNALQFQWHENLTIVHPEIHKIKPHIVKAIFQRKNRKKKTHSLFQKVQFNVIK